jgi:hypothetical protein
MTNYTGVCVNRLSDKIMNTVRVEIPGGHHTDIDTATYVKRRVQPPLTSLPDCKLVPGTSGSHA